MIHLVKIQVYLAFYINNENLNLQTRESRNEYFLNLISLFLISKTIYSIIPFMDQVAEKLAEKPKTGVVSCPCVN